MWLIKIGMSVVTVGAMLALFGSAIGIAYWLIRAVLRAVEGWLNPADASDKTSAARPPTAKAPPPIATAATG